MTDAIIAIFNYNTIIIILMKSIKWKISLDFSISVNLGLMKFIQRSHFTMVERQLNASHLNKENELDTHIIKHN